MDRLNRNGDILAFVAAARRAAAEDIWFAAIALALTLPDVCASVDDPGPGKSKARFVRWWDDYMAFRYVVRPDPDEDYEPFTYVPGEVAYALRCSYLHAGTDVVSSDGQRVRFLGPPNSGHVGFDPKTGAVFLGLEPFVEWVCQAVERWLADRRDDPEAMSRLDGLTTIVPSAIRHVGRTHQP